MLLKNIHIAGNTELQQISVNNELIGEIKKVNNETASTVIEFENAVAFPGLINSHDHLDFNLFPILNTRTYRSYSKWADDIHTTHQDIIQVVQHIPKSLRVQWGIYKNLINGVTTVVEHGEKAKVKTDLLTVLHEWISLHSVQFEKNWRWKLNAPFLRNKGFVIHLGEGTDNNTKKEVDAFINSNLFKRKVVAVHGVAMEERHAPHFSALIWCPDTNYNLLGKTAPITVLKNKLPVLFGTDSTLTSNWNIWQQLRVALKSGMVTEEELMNMITRNPANIWKLNAGVLEQGMQADVVVAKKKGSSFLDTNPEDILLVMRKGEIKLFDETLLPKVIQAGITVNNFCKISVNDSKKYVKGDIAALIAAIKAHYPDAAFPIQVDS